MQYLNLINLRHMGRYQSRLNQYLIFLAPLSSSTALAKGTGSPTFTQAQQGTSGFGAYVPDFEGRLVGVAANSPSFPGLRSVTNLLTYSEDFSNAAWTKANSSTYVGNVLTLQTSQYSSLTRNFVATLPVGVYRLTVKIKNLSGSNKFRLLYATDTLYGLGVEYTAGATYSVFSTLFTASTVLNDVYLSNISTAPTSTFDVAYMQLENLTGATNQNPSEYVKTVASPVTQWFDYANPNTVASGVVTDSGVRTSVYTSLGYLSEPSAQNICLQSNAFNTAPWTDSGTPTATQNVIGPDGTTSAWTITDDNAGAAEYKIQSVVLTATDHTQSIFVKKAGSAPTNYPVFQAFNASGSRVAGCTIDPYLGTATVWTTYTGLTVVTSSAKIESFNADYWRVSLTFTATAASWEICSFLPAARATANSATGTSDITLTGTQVIYGAQLELGSVATSHIPTTSAVTRAATSLTYPTSGNLPTNDFVTYTEIAFNNLTVLDSIISSDNGANGIIAYADASKIYAVRRGGGIAQYTVTRAIGTTYKVVARYSSVTGTDIFINGVKGVNGAGNASVTHPTSAFTVGSGSGAVTNSYDKNVRIYNTALTDAQCIALTT